MKISVKWIVIEIPWHGKKPHEYVNSDTDVAFHKTRKNAMNRAEDMLSRDPEKIFAIAEITIICAGKVAVRFEDVQEDTK